MLIEQSFFTQTMLKSKSFSHSNLQNRNNPLIFAMCFFMVLDFKVKKIGCRETTISFS